MPTPPKPPSPPKPPIPPKAQKAPPVAIPVDAATRWAQEEAFRQAEVGYITDRSRSPLDYWWEQICARAGISYDQVRMRAERGGWRSKREEYWEAVKQAVLTQAKNRAVRDRLAELDEISSLRSELVYLLTPKVVGGRKTFLVPPKSYEGVANAFVRFDQLADTKRQNILAAIDPQLVQEQQADLTLTKGSGSGSSLTTSELEKVAKLLLVERLSQQKLREIPSHADDEADDDADDDAD